MVNCNPETVSTDPDTSDRLYFEPLTAEDVLEIVRREQREGRAARRDRPARRADAAEARRRAAGGGRADPRHLARQHRPCRGPRAVRHAGRASSASSSRPTASRAAATRRCGSPSGSAIRCCCGPSYVLGGRAMEVVDGPQQLDHYIATAVAGVGRQPGADRPLSARRDRGRRRRDLRRRPTSSVAGVLQHIEEAGRPFGRQRLLDPAATACRHEIVAEIERQTRALALALERQGADERPVRGQGRRGLSDRGQSARQPHRAVRRQGDRAADRQDRGAGDGRRDAGRLRRRSAATSTISRSRKRCSRSRASRGPIRCSDRK